MNRYGDYLVHDDVALVADRLEELTEAVRELTKALAPPQPETEGSVEVAKSFSGVWVASGANVTPEETEKAKPVLEEALAKGEKSVVSGGRLWVYHA